MHAKPHGLPNDDIDFSIKIFPTFHLNDLIQLIFLNDLLHHPNILLFCWGMTAHNTVDLWSTRFCCVNWVEAIATRCQVQNYFVLEQMRTFLYGSLKSLKCRLIFNCPLKFLERNVIDMIILWRIWDLFCIFKAYWLIIWDRLFSVIIILESFLFRHFLLSFFHFLRQYTFFLWLTRYLLYLKGHLLNLWLSLHTEEYLFVNCFWLLNCLFESIFSELINL